MRLKATRYQHLLSRRIDLFRDGLELFENRRSLDRTARKTYKLRGGLSTDWLLRSTFHLLLDATVRCSNQSGGRTLPASRRSTQFSMWTSQRPFIDTRRSQVSGGGTSSHSSFLLRSLEPRPLIGGQLEVYGVQIRPKLGCGGAPDQRVDVERLTRHIRQRELRQRHTFFSS